jgi:hypothetical protein
MYIIMLFIYRGGGGREFYFVHTDGQTHTHRGHREVHIEVVERVQFGPKRNAKVEFYFTLPWKEQQEQPSPKFSHKGMC